MKYYFSVLFLLLSSLLGINAQIRMAVLLPLEEQSERGQRMIEFYRGMLMAVDSVKSDGVSVDMYAMHTDGTVAQLQNLLSDPVMKQMDFMIGPADQGLTLTLSQFCKENNIRHIMPFALPGAGNAGKPLYYHVTAPWKSQQQEAVRRIVSERPSLNYIYMNTGNADERGANFVNTLREALKNNKLDSKTCIMNEGSAAINIVLNPQKTNIIYTDNTNMKTFGMLISALNEWKAETNMSDISIELLGFPEWKAYTSTYLQEMYKWNTTIYTPYFRNPTSPHTSQFEQRYHSNFQQAILEGYPQYALMGFDIAYYFLHGYSLLGNNLEELGHTLHYDPYQHPLQFFRTSPDNGTTNSAMLLVNYSPENIITVR